MKIGLFVSFMAICLLGPAYVLGQTNAEILLAAENKLEGLGCMAYQNTAATSGTGVSSELCFADEIGPDPNDTHRWYRVYKAPQRKTENKNAIWWIGDSRTVGMYSNKIIAGENEAVLAKVSMGYDWLVSTALPKLENCMRDGDTVILALGANDIWRYNSYINLYEGLIENNNGEVTFWIVSVNPVSDSKTRYLNNADIRTFNNKMKERFGDNWIDTFEVVKDSVSDECTDSEGLHYNSSCGIEQIVYSTVMGAISGNENQ